MAKATEREMAIPLGSKDTGNGEGTRHGDKKVKPQDAEDQSLQQSHVGPPVCDEGLPREADERSCQDENRKGG